MTTQRARQALNEAFKRFQVLPELPIFGEDAKTPSTCIHPSDPRIDVHTSCTDIRPPADDSDQNGPIRLLLLPEAVVE